jgi:hypothetical protein
MRADQSSLMVGFRSPLRDQRAIIASIDNPEAMFEAGEASKIGSRLVTLDLCGNGIRGMAYVPLLGGYLVIAGPVAREQTNFGLWFWSGDADDAAHQVSVPDLSGFEHAEGVSPALIEGRRRILIVSDDGTEAKGRFACLLRLDPQLLQI